MDPLTARLECLRIAAGLRQPSGTIRIPSGLVPEILADARAFAEFTLSGDDDDAPAGDGEPRPDIDVTIKGRFPPLTRADIADHIDPLKAEAQPRQAPAAPDWTTRGFGPNDPLPEPGGPFFTGGFRDGPASEP